MKIHYVISILLLFATSAFTQETPKKNPCEIAEARQFDFWLGTWDLTWKLNEKTGTGTNTITKKLNQCVIQENFNGTPSMPLIGMSVSTYNRQKKKWQQTWVDNNGSYLDFVGEFKDDKMILSRQAERQGKKIHQRMVFSSIQKDNLDWSWESSEDNGKT